MSSRAGKIPASKLAGAAAKGAATKKASAAAKGAATKKAGAAAKKPATVRPRPASKAASKTAASKGPGAKRPMAVRPRPASKAVSKGPGAKRPMAVRPRPASKAVSKGPGAKRPTTVRPRPASKAVSKGPGAKRPMAVRPRPRPGTKSSTLRPRPRPGAKGATKSSTLRPRPRPGAKAAQSLAKPGDPIEISEKDYRGSSDSDTIDPSYDLKQKKWYADFRIGPRFLRMFGATQADITAKVQAYRDTTKVSKKETVSNELTLELEQEKLDIRASLPRMGKRVKTLQKELSTMNRADPKFQVFTSELAEAKKVLSERQLRIRRVDSQLKILTRRAVPLAKGPRTRKNN